GDRGEPFDPARNDVRRAVRSLVAPAHDRGHARDRHAPRPGLDRSEHAFVVRPVTPCLATVTRRTACSAARRPPPGGARRRGPPPDTPGRPPRPVPSCAGPGAG